MKNKFLIVAIFIVVFCIVSGAMIFLNSKYQNFFGFDFSPRTVTEEPPALLAENETVSDNLLFPADSTNSIDSTLIQNSTNAPGSYFDTAVLDSIQKLKEELESPEIKTTTPQNFLEQSAFNKSSQTDSSYQDWVKKTADLYALMDAAKAAKIIQNFSDNIARDIIYNMRKKNAAKILAELNPELANRITSHK